MYRYLILRSTWCILHKLSHHKEYYSACENSCSVSSVAQEEIFQVWENVWKCQVWWRNLSYLGLSLETRNIYQKLCITRVWVWSLNELGRTVKCYQITSVCCIVLIKHLPMLRATSQESPFKDTCGLQTRCHATGVGALFLHESFRVFVRICFQYLFKTYIVTEVSRE